MIVCTFDTCQRTARSKKLCKAHYGQMHRGEELRPLRPRRTKAQVADGECRLDGCERAHSALGLCKAHYQQKYRGSDLSDVRLRRGQVLGSWEPYRRPA